MGHISAHQLYLVGLASPPCKDSIGDRDLDLEDGVDLKGFVSSMTSFLRGPIAILFISRDTFSDSIAKRFRACFPGVSHKYRAICCKTGYRTEMFM